MVELDDEGLSREEFQAVLQSRGFQKMLLYQRLADGIEVLQERDLLFDSMVSAITKQHSQVESEEVTREFVSLFCQEVEAYTEPLDDRIVERIQYYPTVQEEVKESQETLNEAEETILTHIESRLEEEDALQLKAKEIGADTGLQSTHVGGILGRWRKSEEAPFSVSAVETQGSGNLWKIQK